MFEALRVRDFRWLWSGRLVSSLLLATTVILAADGLSLAVLALR